MFVGDGRGLLVSEERENSLENEGSEDGDLS